jgi:hypothetical protein
MDDVGIGDILDVWLMDAIEGLPARIMRADSPLAAEFWIQREGAKSSGLQDPDTIASVTLYHGDGDVEQHIKVHLYVGETDDESSIESFDLDLGDPSALGRLRAHVKKYSNI